MAKKPEKPIAVDKRKDKGVKTTPRCPTKGSCWSKPGRIRGSR